MLTTSVVLFAFITQQLSMFYFLFDYRIAIYESNKIF